MIVISKKHKIIQRILYDDMIFFKPNSVASLTSYTMQT